MTVAVHVWTVIRRTRPNEYPLNNVSKAVSSLGSRAKMGPAKAGQPCKDFDRFFWKKRSPKNLYMVQKQEKIDDTEKVQQPSFAEMPPGGSASHPQKRQKTTEAKHKNKIEQEGNTNSDKGLLTELKVADEIAKKLKT